MTMSIMYKRKSKQRYPSLRLRQKDERAFQTICAVGGSKLMATSNRERLHCGVESVFPEDSYPSSPTNVM